MSGERILKSLAKGAVRLVTPYWAAEAYDDSEEAVECAEVLGDGLVPENTWDDVEDTGERMDRALKPWRTAKTVFRALRSRRF